MTDARISRAAALFDLHGRVAIVTGGAGMLGYQHGDVLASAGAHVVLLDLEFANPAARAKQIADKHGVEALGLSCDITSEPSIEKLEKRFLKSLAASTS
jgi:NAD(P)-dependent dehydrogenase (short-subunit alcohol dehydrogenase family)